MILCEIKDTAISMLISYKRNRGDFSKAEEPINTFPLSTDVYKAVSKQFNISKWICYQAHLQLAIEKQDKEVCLSILKEMLPAMKEEWHPKQFRLY